MSKNIAIMLNTNLTMLRLPSKMLLSPNNVETN
jgi:hypothetical protein